MPKQSIFCRSIFVLAVFVCLSGLPSPAKAAMFNIAAGDVSGPDGLIAAINSANSSPDADTINLAANSVYSLTEPDNASAANGANGLPIITSTITINGNGAKIIRDEDLTCDLNQLTDDGEFRIFFINNSGNLTLNGITIESGCIDGQPSTLPGAGGGVANNGGRLTINNSIISNNEATDGGGIRSVGTLIVYNSTIAYNGASNLGGGLLFATTGSTLIINTTISSNDATYGGGIFGIFSANITNSTIAGNFAHAEGGGISGASPFTANIKNSILAGSKVISGGGNCHTGLGATFNDLGDNLSSDTSCPFSITNYNTALLGPLRYNGGTTLTHALLNTRSNPAVDYISISNCREIVSGSPITLDQRGEARPLNGDLSGSALCDSGAFEAGVCGDGTISDIDEEECDDGDNTGGDGCSAACKVECVNPATDCAPATTCQDAVCNATAGGGAVCSVTDRTDGAACNDGSLCTRKDTCQTGACVGGSLLNCDDVNDCTVDACNPDTGGCTHTPLTCGGFIANICGTPGNDTIILVLASAVVNGNDGNDNISAALVLPGGGVTICGGEGDDTISGSLGPDKLFGNGGNDTINGDAGNDIINGGAGADYCDGGLGADKGTACETFVQ